MHSGRQYRRLLPPNLFSNFHPYWRPAVQWDCSLWFQYAGNSFFNLPPFRIKPFDLNPKAGYYIWAGQFSEGVYDFGVRIEFRLVKHNPLHKIVTTMADNIGSLLQGTYMVNYIDGIDVSPLLWFPRKDPVVITAGLFTGLQQTLLYPVHYQNEP